MLLLNKLNSNVAYFTPQEQAFSQTLKTGHPEGMFPIKRLSEFPCIPSKKGCPWDAWTPFWPGIVLQQMRLLKVVKISSRM